MIDMHCPRCRTALTVEPRAGGDAEAHRCMRCYGIWLDGCDVGWIAPALKRHGARVEELLERGARRGTGIGACPRGHGVTLEFPFFDLWLDLCESCHGLWLDGDETRFVENAGREELGLAETAGSPHRGQNQVGSERVACTVCAKSVHPRRTFLSADGTVCDDCVEIQNMADELDDDRIGSRLRRAPGKLLRLFGKLLDADGKRLRRGGFTNWNL